MKTKDECWSVFTMDNWHGFAVYHAPHGRSTRYYEERHQFKSLDDAMKIVRKLESENHSAGFDNVTVVHEWNEGYCNHQFEYVYQGKLNAAYAA